MLHLRFFVNLQTKVIKVNTETFIVKIKIMCRKVGLFFVSFMLLCSVQQSYAQSMGGIQNLPAYDMKRLHFGFVLGVNEMNFAVKRTPDYRTFDSLLIVQPESQWGFHIGIISDLRLGEYFNARFIPSLSFGDRILNYSLIEKGRIENYSKKIESTFIDFPLLMKFKSDRMTNMRAYVIGGFKYSIDMASLAKKKLQDDDVIKLKRNDYSIELGTGFDFYLEYFKFGVEIKMAYGLRDLLKREGTVYTNSIEKLNTKIFYLTFTFE
jgi:hypothetical protein